MKPILLIILVMSIMGCAFSFMYGLHVTYEADGDSVSETLGDTEEEHEMKGEE